MFRYIFSYVQVYILLCLGIYSPMSDLAPMLIYSPPLYLRSYLTLSRDTLDSQTGRSSKSTKRNIEYEVYIEYIEYT